jgi:plastocyanin
MSVMSVSPPRHPDWAAAALVVALALAPGTAVAQVSGQVVVTEAGGRVATDIASAVVYLEGRGFRGPAPIVEMATDGRQFRPRVLIVPVGTTVQFRNLDPFNHNVFSLSEPNAFDLGLYGRGETRTHRFTRPGVVRVYCNIHPRMSAFILVRDNPWYTQPGADGAWQIADVPPGRYVLHVWHERAPDELTRAIVVPAGGLAGLADTVDAAGYRWVDHPNKYGKSYNAGGARERY